MLFIDEDAANEHNLHSICTYVTGDDVGQLFGCRNSSPKTLGSIPWRGRVFKTQFFCTSECALVQACVCLKTMRTIFDTIDYAVCVYQYMHVSFCLSFFPTSFASSGTNFWILV